MYRLFIFFFITWSQIASGQNTMTPELLWQLGRVSGLGITDDGRHVVYSVSTPNAAENKSSRKLYQIPVGGGVATEINSNPLPDKNLAPDGSGRKIFHKEVKIINTLGTDLYPELTKSNAYIFNDIPVRHWDTWEEGAFDHVFLTMEDGKEENAIDLMAGEPHDSPQKPFGGDEDYIWRPDGQAVLYVTKKKSGKDYTVSTNTDIYEYNIKTKATRNLTEGRMGYDIQPSYNEEGMLAYLSMRRDGYESDKQDLIIFHDNKHYNLTGSRDDLHVLDFKWSQSGRRIHFLAPTNGTIQLFEIGEYVPGSTNPAIRQITFGDFDVNGIVGQSGDLIVVSRSDMNHANELYTVNIPDGTMKQLTHVNDEIYSSIKPVRTERRWVRTTDNKQMLVWMIYPPDFNPVQKYPTLLYCQGGPQSPLTQFYSFRWNFQLMASMGYVIVAPNRRGMPGHGTKWNEQISKDHGGQVMKDYLTAIDAVRDEPFVDNERLGCIGASYGGYSAFMLAGIHDGRFKSFISHDGIFDMRSMYGTTEELWFVDWDWGGPYWDKRNKAAQKSYRKFNPINYVDNWDTPIMIIQGGKDYRVPIEQGLQAFQAARLQGIRSKLLYLPDENHWVLSAQNALIWQHEFFKWLEETLPASGSTPNRS